MHRYDLISCHDCDVLHSRRPVAPREKARCVRCRAVLYRGIYSDVNRMAAITLGAIVVFLIAQFCPIVQLQFNGYTSSSTLLGAINVMWHERMRVVAVIVFLVTLLLPAVELGALLYVTLGLRAGFKPPGFDALLRAVAAARRWGMTEVLMVGILVALVKISSLAQILVQPGLLGFGALTLMLAIVVSFDPRMLWNVGDDIEPPADAAAPAGGTDSAAGALRYRRLADHLGAGKAPLTTAAGLLACHTCDLVTPALAVKHQRCPRCHAALHRRQPDSVARTWALLLAAAILYIPANVLPVLHTHSLYGMQDDTIISGVIYFWNTGAPELAVIIFIASIAVPMLKLAALSLLAWTSQRRSRWNPYQRTLLYRVVEFIGRWSMLDIFVITVTVALVRFKTLAEITPGPGALAFCSVVILTMLASMQFDPRLIWDHIELNGEPHV